MSADPALDVLLLPFQQGLVAWPDTPLLFLGARTGVAMGALRGRALRCEQGFKPDVDALQRDGFDVAQQVQGQFDAVLVLPPRQRDASRALLARALASLTPSGVLVVCASNNEGARSVEADLRRLAGSVNTQSKQHCRVMWLHRDTATIDAHLHAQWLQADAPRQIVEGRYLSRPGLFAWDRIDAASRLLAECLPDDLTGHAADLGAGFGYLSDALLSRCPGIVALDLFEAQAQALPLACENLQRHANRVALQLHWHDVSTGVPGVFDVIVSNPPFHTGRADRPELGQSFLRAAASALKPGGRLYAVANRHLPYEAVLAAGFSTWKILRDANGFKVFAATR